MVFCPKHIRPREMSPSFVSGDCTASQSIRQHFRRSHLRGRAKNTPLTKTFNIYSLSFCCWTKYNRAMIKDCLTCEVLVAIAAVVVVLVVFFVSATPKGTSLQRSELKSARKEVRELLETTNCGERCMLLFAFYCCIGVALLVAILRPNDSFQRFYLRVPDPLS